MEELIFFLFFISTRISDKEMMEAVGRGGLIMEIDAVVSFNGVLATVEGRLYK